MKLAHLFPLPLLVACVPPGAIPDPVSAPDPAPAPQQQVTQPRPAQRPVVSAPTPRPVVSPPATPSSVAIAAWADVSLSPGRWVYQPPRGGPSRALFGPANAPSFVVTCEPGRSIALTRTGAGAGALTIRTSSTARPLPATRSPQGLRAVVPASDPLLDAIAFSRGRFAVEAPGAAQLVIPAWPELARVVEDCRR
jgi:hypothetical protein